MENLQKLVPFFEELLQHWYQLTMQHQVYAICLAISVWLITSIFYSIRIGFFKRNQKQILSANQQLQTRIGAAESELETTRSQIQQVQESLLQAENSATAEAQRASRAEQQLNENRQQLVGGLSGLVDAFELHQSDLPAADAGNLLTEFVSVIARVSDRFRSEQQAKTQLQLKLHAEAEKLVEKDAVLDSLQSRLDIQTQQLAKLEMAVEKYQAQERQMEIDQQHFAQEKRHLESELASRSEQAKPAEPAVAAFIQSNTVAVTEKTVESMEKVLEPHVSQPSVQAPEPAVSKALPTQQAKAAPTKSKLGFLGRAMEKISKLDEKLGSPSPMATVLEEVTEAPPVAEVVEAVHKAVETIADTRKSNEGVGNKLGGMFDGLKKKPVKQTGAADSGEALTVQTGSELPQVDASQSKPKSSGLFGKFKSKK